MDTLGPETQQPRRPASTAVAPDTRTRRASASATPSSTQKPAAFDVATHPSAVAYQNAHPKRAIPRFGPYLLLQTLGEGEFGKVKLGLHATWGEEVAVKLIRRGSVENALRMSKVEREIEVLRTLNHPNIVRLYDVIETDKYIGIVLEYASGGELFDHILAHRFLRERDACKLFAQLISGVSYIHQKKIVHRDLKLENLLLDRNRNVIITDFGFANRFEHRPDDLMQTSCGSPCYAAPELVISEGEYVGSAVDIWSCGVILYAMLAGYLPFDDDPANPDGDNINLLYKYIVTTPLTFPDYVSQAARDLLARMLVPDPKHRADLATIMAHPWLAPYSAQFQLSVDQLEQQAVEQQHAKRMAYQRQIRKKQAQQAQASQPSAKSSRTQSTRPANAMDDPSDLLYTSSASPTRRDRVGASAIVLPSPVAAPVDTEMLSVDAQLGAEAPGGDRKSRGYRHTIQLEYDTSRTSGVPPPVPVAPSAQRTTVDAPVAQTIPAKAPISSESPSDSTKDQALFDSIQRRSLSNIRATTTSRAAPPSAFATSSNATPKTTHLTDAEAVDTGEPTRNDDEMGPISTSDVAVPAVRVSVSPPMSPPAQESNVLAALYNGHGSSPKQVVQPNGDTNATAQRHGPAVTVDGLSQGSILGGDQARSPILVTPTTTESADLPTPVGPEASEISRPAVPRSASMQVKSSGKETAQLPSSIGPVRNVSTTSSTGATRSKSSRHSTKPAEKHVDEDVGNTSVSSSKSRRKTLSLMVEPFQRPFRTRTPVDPIPVHSAGQIVPPEQKDTQPLRSAPPSSFSAPTTAPPSTVAPSGGATPSVAPPSAYKTNTERFMAEGTPVGPASSTSKAKRVMNWFRKRSLATSETSVTVAQSSAPPNDAVRREPLVISPSETPLSDSATATPTQRVEAKNSGGLDSLSTTSGPKAPVSIVKPSKPMVNRAGMRVHEGAVDQAMVTSGSPLDALTHAEAVLAEMGITFQKESEFKFRCLRPKKRKGISGSVGPLGGMSAGHVGSAASNGIDRRGLPLPPPSFSGPGGMLRGLLRRSSAQPSGTPESETSSLPEPVYGERTEDAQDEVRFFVELTRIDRLEDTYSIDLSPEMTVFDMATVCVGSGDAFLDFKASTDDTGRTTHDPTRPDLTLSRIILDSVNHYHPSLAHD
ncbi:Serine/threonine-protein kinase [Ceratobasidium sp. AG-Ba]|nr:Serine/threonine-protein kinase [Ceratobasidium sp. AG-Ba]